jgi:molecular chaperone DnaK
MVDEAQAHADEDAARREAIETKNKLDSLIYNSEKLVNENKDKIAEEDRTAMEAALEKGKKALEKPDDVEGMKAAVENIEKASHKMAEAMYRAASGGAAPPPAGGDGAPADAPPAGGAPKDDGVIDAEFEEAK